MARSPSTVQNSYSTKSERGPSVTDQRQRLTISGSEELNPFAPEQKMLGAIFNHWKISGIMTYGSGRPANATVSGDPNQDGNTSNDRLSKIWTQRSAGTRLCQYRFENGTKTLISADEFIWNLLESRSMYSTATIRNTELRTADFTIQREGS